MAFHRLMRCTHLGEEFALFGDGKQTRDFTFIGDAVQATVDAATKGRPGCVYNIGGGSRVSMLDVIVGIEKITGTPVKLRRESSQKGDMRDTYADTTQAQKDLDYRPSVTLREGLEAEWQWLRSLLENV
jgi:nucleoside-diphosphate-sugar epimerase